jgi:hypothetical protein
MERLGAGELEWPEGAVVVSFEGDQLHVYPRQRVAYLLVVEALPEAPILPWSLSVVSRAG